MAADLRRGWVCCRNSRHHALVRELAHEHPGAGRIGPRLPPMYGLGPNWGIRTSGNLLRSLSGRGGPVKIDTRPAHEASRPGSVRRRHATNIPATPPVGVFSATSSQARPSEVIVAAFNSRAV